MKIKNISFVIFILLIFISLSYAIINIPINQLDENLNATISIQKKEFSKPLEDITVLARVENPTNKRYVLYLLKKEGEVYKPIQTMGITEPYSIIDLNLTIKIEYFGDTYKNTTYALILSDEADTIKGKTFILNEDWSEYENNTAETVAKAHLLLVPAISLISLLILMILIESAFHRHIKGLLVNEYTLHSLFFPKLKGRPYEEKIASIMMNPIFWIFEIIIVGALFYFIFNSISVNMGFGTAIQLFTISGLSAFLFPLIYLGLVWFLEMKPLRFLWSLFIFGSASALFAFILNTLIGEYVLSTFFSTMASSSLILISAALVAPIIEESLKGLGLLVMSGHHEYDDILAGLFFGFAIGVGFSFVENWFYFASKTNPFEIGFLAWIQLIIYRSFFNSLAHGAITGTGGAIIGYLKSYTPTRKYIRLGFIAALFIAIPLHSLFNITALLDGNIKTIDLSLGLPFIFNPLFVVFLTIIFVSIYFIGTSKRIQKMVNV